MDSSSQLPVISSERQKLNEEIKKYHRKKNYFDLFDLIFIVVCYLILISIIVSIMLLNFNLYLNDNFGYCNNYSSFLGFNLSKFFFLSGTINAFYIIVDVDNIKTRQFISIIERIIHSIMVIIGSILVFGSNFECLYNFDPVVMYACLLIIYSFVTAYSYE